MLDIDGEASGKKVRIGLFSDSDLAREEERKSVSGCLVKVTGIL